MLLYLYLEVVMHWNDKLKEDSNLISFLFSHSKFNSANCYWLTCSVTDGQLSTWKHVESSPSVPIRLMGNSLPALWLTCLNELFYAGYRILGWVLHYSIFCIRPSAGITGFAEKQVQWMNTSYTSLFWFRSTLHFTLMAFIIKVSKHLRADCTLLSYVRRWRWQRGDHVGGV